MNAEWGLPPESLNLPAQTVHVWRVNVRSLTSQQLRSLWHALAPDEQQRAERFVRPQDRDAFIAARGFLRNVLSQYLKIAPAQVQFGYGSHGKPYLIDNPAGLHFNLSHSGDLALCAVVQGQDVGIDVEKVRPDVEYAAIAERFFSPQEIAVFNSLPMGDRCEAFFRAWTGKEAYIKALGGGIYQALHQVEISLTPKPGSLLLSIDGDPQTAAQWCIQTIHPGAGYIAALALAASIPSDHPDTSGAVSDSPAITLPVIQCWQWQVS